MRRYTLVFMEQRLGASQLTPMTADDGYASFNSPDDEAALAHINGQLLDRLKHCARGELSSLRILPDPQAVGGTRLVDDSHASPHFQDYYVKYNSSSKVAELDFDSTRTALIGARYRPPG